MDAIDFLLNLAGLLFWLNWRSVKMRAATQPSVLSLASTLKRVEARRPKRWVYLAGLVVLVGGRSLVYWHIGSALHWTPALRLGAISPPFRSDSPGRMLLFSALSFLLALGVFYLGMMLLSIVNRNVPDADPIQRLVRLQLGWVARRSASIQFLLPLPIVGLLWLVLHGPFVRLGLISATPAGELLQQTVILGIGSFLAWKYLIMAMLAAHVLNSYVYLGSSPVWDYVSVTARKLLWPLRWLPLSIGKADFAPAVAMALVWIIAEYGASGLTRLYQHPPF